MDITIKFSISLLAFLFFIQAIIAFKNKKTVMSMRYFSEPDVIIEGWLSRLLSIFTMLGCIFVWGSVAIFPDGVDWSDRSILSMFLFIAGGCFVVLPRYVVLIWDANK